MTAANSKHLTGLPPFLQKLRLITETTPADLSSWSEDGLSYVVKDSDRFEVSLKQHFKGSLQTFVRQLHFYGFRKVDAHDGAWSFVHKDFQRDKPQLLQRIKRKSRADAQASAAQVEVAQLRSQVAQLQDTVEELRERLDSVLGVLDDAGMTPAGAHRRPPALSSDGNADELETPVGAAAGTRRQTQRKRARPAVPVEHPEPLSDAEDDDQEQDEDMRAAVPAALSRGFSSDSGFARFCSMLDPLDADADAQHGSGGGSSSSAMACKGLDGSLELLSDLDLNTETEKLFQDLVSSEPATSPRAAVMQMQQQDAESDGGASESGSVGTSGSSSSQLSRVLDLLKEQQGRMGRRNSNGSSGSRSSELRNLTQFQKNHALPAQQVGAN